MPDGTFRTSTNRVHDKNYAGCQLLSSDPFKAYPILRSFADRTFDL